jgi:general secretion pathway protein A
MNTRGLSRPNLNKERVYLDFYNLDEAPFSITPDPAYLFYSTTHRNAIDKLLYGISNRMGFLLLVGEVGTGKTTICRSLLDSLAGKASTVYIINPSLSGTQLISSILDDLGIAYPANASKKELLDTLNRFFLSRDDNALVVIIIDDAQTMHLDSLEDLRLLSNLETDKQKLLQILLVGQPELLTHLSRPDMRQLKQRVALTCRLEFLSKAEVEGYITRRLFISGNKGYIRFKADAVRLIFSATKGIPRLINRICDYALTAGYVTDTHAIGRRHIKKAFKELKGLEDSGIGAVNAVVGKRTFWLALALISTVYAGIAVAVWQLVPGFFPAARKAAMPARSLPLSAIIPSTEPMATRPADPVQKTVTGIQPENQASPVGRESQNTAETQHDSLTPPVTIAQKDIAGMPPESQAPPATMPSDTKHAYIVRVASFRTMQRIEKAADKLHKKGIQSSWKFVDLGEKGQWYGLYAGSFETLEEARKFKTDHKLFDAVIERRQVVQ